MADKHWPIDPSSPVASPFGYRPGFDIPGSSAWQSGLHDGTDFAAGFGTPVYAAHAGRVRNLQDPGGYGQYVQIDGNGLMTQYGHVRDMWIVPDNTWVEPGTLIAGVGSEGMSTGPHLHFRLHVMETPTDPIPWLADADWNPGGVTPQPPSAAPNEQTVHDWGVRQGMTPAGRAALLGTMLAESGIDPARTEGDMGWDALQNDGVWPGGAGYLQWTNTRNPVTGAKSYRRDNLAAFAAAAGKPWSDGPTQLDFMLNEIAASPADMAMWQRVKTATDPITATRDFNIGGDDPTYAGFIRPGVYGDRDQFAADYYRRITAGDFGTLTPTPPTPPPYVPVHLDAYDVEGDDMLTRINITADLPKGMPATYIHKGAVLIPMLDASLSGEQDVITLSWGMFLEYVERYLAATRLGLDGVPVEKQLRDQAAAALAKFNTVS